MLSDRSRVQVLLLQFTSRRNKFTVLAVFKSLHPLGTSWHSSSQVLLTIFSLVDASHCPLAGLFSGLVSHIAATRVLFPRLVSQLSPLTTAAVTAAKSVPKPTRLLGRRPAMDILPSLGASGAIYAAVSLTALGFPNSDISLLFLPVFSIPIQWGVGALVMVDIVGIFRGWR